MSTVSLSRAFLMGLACAGAFAVQAQTLPADAPAGSTVQCKDGSYASPDAKSGACRGHKGIKTWYGKAAAPAVAAPAVAVAPAPAAPAAATPAAKTAAPVAAAPAKPATTTAMAPGGGAGKVWANDATHVYHCMGDRYYGKTKQGEYMSEADAKSKGMHAAHNKACS